MSSNIPVLKPQKVAKILGDLPTSDFESNLTYTYRAAHEGQVFNQILDKLNS